LAAKDRHKGVVWLLLATGQVNINLKDTEYSQTLLLWAVKSRYKSIVQLLLAISQVKTNSKDKWGQTLLSRAAINRHKGIV
jgi:ankyrin repeat protein